MSVYDFTTPELLEEPKPCVLTKVLMHLPKLQPCSPFDINSINPDKLPCVPINDFDPAKCEKRHNGSPNRIYKNCVMEIVGYTTGIHCWDILWPHHARGSLALVGVATDKFLRPEHNYPKRECWGWDLSCNKLYHNDNHTKPYPEFKNSRALYTPPQTFRLILDMDLGILSFSYEGKHLGVAFTGLRGKKLYPMVSMTSWYYQIFVQYIGGLKRRPPSLRALCRLAYREHRSDYEVESDIRDVDLPKHLKLYVGGASALCSECDSYIQDSLF